MTTEQQLKEAQVLKTSAEMLRTLSRENVALTTKLAEEEKLRKAYEVQVRCEKLAAQMHQKGLETDIDFPDLVASLKEAAAEGELDTIAKAVDLVGPDMSIKTASLHDAPVVSGSDLERYVTGFVG